MGAAATGKLAGRAFQGLRPDQRALLELIHRHHRSVEQIAELLGSSPARVRELSEEAHFDWQRGGQGTRRRLFLSAAALALMGLAMLAEATVTVLWQEPFSSLAATADQRRLAGELGELEDAQRRRPAPRRRSSAHLRRAAVAAGRDSRPGSALGEIRIRRIGVDFAMVQGTDPASVRRGPGHYRKTALPGQPGTVGVAGHRTTYSAPFRHIDRLRRGDRIDIRMPYGSFTYRVEGSKVVSPDTRGLFTPRRSQRLVLTACHPLFSAKQRIVVSARLTRVRRI